MFDIDDISIKIKELQEYILKINSILIVISEEYLSLSVDSDNIESITIVQNEQKKLCVILNNNSSNENNKSDKEKNSNKNIKNINNEKNKNSNNKNDNNENKRTIEDVMKLTMIKELTKLSVNLHRDKVAKIAKNMLAEDSLGSELKEMR